MKKTIINTIIVVAIVLTTSCVRYQVVTVESKMPKSDNKEFVIENDTLKIVYAFTGQYCPVSIRVYNKLAQPLYIDWSKSAAIMNEQRISYWKDKAVLNGSATGINVNPANTFSITSSDINGVIYRDEKVSFIPSKSFIKRGNVNDVYLYPSFFNVKNDASAQNINIQTNMGVIPATRYTFNEASNKNKFRSYLTLSVKDDFSAPIIYDNEFWISEIIQTDSKPEDISKMSSNQFYLKKTTGAGKVLGWTFVIALVVGLAALTPVTK